MHNERISKSPYNKQFEILVKIVNKRLATEDKIFEVDKENEEVIYWLLLYFNNDPLFNSLKAIKNPSLKKSLLIIGNTGSGKTILMESIQKMKYPDNSFRIEYCSELPDCYKLQRQDLLKRTIRIYNIDGSFNHVYYDDLGDEELISDFGPYIEVMDKIIVRRNRIWLTKNVKSHITTNLPLSEQKSRYGERFYSRIIQQSNIIYLGAEKDSKDRRIPQ